MAEEESFTFVDKRRTQAAVPEPSLSEPPVPDVPSEPMLEDGPLTDDLLGDSLLGDDAQGAPSTYELLGYCINLLAQQSWQKLGLLADPQTGEATPDLAEAKVAIDAVTDLAAHLEKAPESVVPAAMRRELKTLLNDLRLNYVSRHGQGNAPLS